MATQAAMSKARVKRCGQLRDLELAGVELFPAAEIGILLTKWFAAARSLSWRRNHYAAKVSA